jgi:hypothetical protein
MSMRVILFFIFILLINVKSYSQIVVDKAGDSWDLKVYKALELIKTTDTEVYNNVLMYCDRITFWSGGYSTNEGYPNKKGSIIISSADAKYNSINNIAAIIVHESLHLYYRYTNIKVSNEERKCYVYEYEFLVKVPNIDPFLLKHCLNQIQLRAD